VNQDTDARFPAARAKALPARGVTLRAILIGLFLLPINAYWIVHIEIVRFAAFPSIIPITMNSLFMLLLLVLLNLLVRKATPRFAFSAVELLTIYIMLNIGTVLVGVDIGQVLIYVITHPIYYATAFNNWEKLFVHDIPQWMIISDERALRNFYQGGTSFFIRENYLPWLVPLAVWAVCLLAVFWIMLCINILLRKQWTERERLTYPLVQVPLALVSGPRFFQNKWLWLGFAFSSAIALINGLHVLYPTLPEIPTQSIQTAAPINPPWDKFGGSNLFFYPFAVGITMLIPTELAFSSWFFLFFNRFQLVAFSAKGYSFEHGFPWLYMQAGGALLGLSVFTLWRERRYLLAVLRRAFGRGQELDDKTEPLSYRAALIGILLGVLALSLVAWKAGFSLRVLWIFLAFYLLIAIGVTRLRAELGAPVHDIYYVGPEVHMFNLAGNSAFSVRDLSVMSLFYWMSRQYGCHPMPAQLEGYKMGDSSGMQLRHLTWAMAAAGVAGIICALIVIPATMHVYGAASAKVRNVSPWLGGEPWRMLQYYRTEPSGPQYPQLTATLAGFLFALVLMTVRLRYGNFPFHPLGVALAGSSRFANILWLSVFIGWIIKVLLLRYGGQRAYLRGLPVAYGLILGDCVWGTIWLVIGLVLKINTYSVWY